MERQLKRQAVSFPPMSTVRVVGAACQGQPRCLKRFGRRTAATAVRRGSPKGLDAIPDCHLIAAGAWLIAVSAVLLASCVQPKPLAIMGEIPDFQLTSETGQPFDSKSLTGHIWVADFIYTTCDGPCPMMSHQMHQLQTLTAEMPEVKLRIFLAGLGVTVPAAVTGSITPNPGPPLNLPITVVKGSPVTVVSAIAVPGSISGVWQVDIRMPAIAVGAAPISLSVGTVPVRDTNLTIWVR